MQNADPRANPEIGAFIRRDRERLIVWVKPLRCNHLFSVLPNDKQMLVLGDVECEPKIVFVGELASEEKSRAE
jgi:hypothetical protein